ncbi:MAG: hypothetical protein ACOCSP_01955 [archaeon]
MDRRTYLTTGLSVVLIAIAGCTNDGTEPTNDDEPGTSPAAYSGTGTEKYEGTWSDTDVSGTWKFTVNWETGDITGSTDGDVEADITGSAEDGSIEAEGDAAMGTVTWSGTFSADGSAVSGEWSGLGDSGTWSGSRVTATETTEATTDETTETVSYGGLYNYDRNYAVDIEYDDPDSDQAGSGTVRYHDGDYYMRVEPDDSDDVFEIYHIGDDDYAVINSEECYRNPGPMMKPDADVQSKSDAEAHGSKPDTDLEPAGTTEIDGETVYIFEVTGEDIDGVLTLYVSESTGYLRRVEGNWGTADFHSWGATDPITEPDMDCKTI